MNKDQHTAIKELFVTLATLTSNLDQVHNRCERSEGTWKQLAKDNPDGFTEFYQRAQAVTAGTAKAIKGGKKMEDLLSKMKPEKDDFNAIAKDLKKLDAEIDAADKAISDFIITRRKVEKLTSVKVSGQEVDMKAMLGYLDIYMRDRGLFNKELQAVYKLTKK